jgi:hypothetical protein
MSLNVSPTGKYLFAGMSGSLQRFLLPSLQPDIRIDLGSDFHGPYQAFDLQPSPLSDGTAWQ